MKGWVNNKGKEKHVKASRGAIICDVVGNVKEIIP